MEPDAPEINNPQSLNVELDYEKENVDQSEPYSEEVSVDDATSPQEEEVVVEDYSEKPRSKRWEKERRAREEKYLLTRALAEEKQRNLELQDYLSRSVDHNTLSKAEKAIEQLEEAEAMHAQALESGDAFAAAKASTALIQANLAVERAANAKLYSREEERQEVNPSHYAANGLLQDWLTDNPEFNEDSDYFDGRLVSKVAPLVDQLDAKLKRRGQGHLISSPLYFDVLDAVVAQSKQGKRLDRPSTGAVSSRSYDRQYSSRSRPILTEQQRAVAAGCNMTDDQYINWLKKYDNERNNKQRDSYGY